MSTKKNKFSIYIYVVITIIGCVLACSSIIPNDYLKLVVVMGALGVGSVSYTHLRAHET